MSALGFDSPQTSSSSTRSPRIFIRPPPKMTPSSSWLDQLRSQKYSLLPSSSSPSSPDLRPRTTSIRKRLFAASLVALVFVGSAGYVMKSDKMTSDVDPYQQWEAGNKQDGSQVGGSGWGIELSEEPELPELPEQVDDDVASGESEEPVDMRGWTEEMGWAPRPDSGLADLGEVAERRYRLNTELGEDGSRAYFLRLYDFVISLPAVLHYPLLGSLYRHAPPNYPDSVREPPFWEQQGRPSSPAMVSYKNIHQTDKTFNPDNVLSAKWAQMNAADGWALNFLDDAAALSWVESIFANSDVEWAWHFMHRGVLKADFLRYLLPLVEGGVYSDIDTEPIRPIEQWGHTNVEYLSLNATDGPNWRSKLSTHPSVIVSIDVDVHSYPNWEDSWPRPLGICQWTLSSAPNHPIFLDAVRRVVNASRVVEDWETWRAQESHRLEDEGRPEEAQELRDQNRDHAMNVMEWTGPGLFTDSVLAYILARYNVTWHRLRGLDHPLRIGDVLILPITGFSPGGQPDFRAEGPDSPQANVLHNFRGSWKADGA